MILLAKVLASLIRRVITGAGIAALAVLIARSFFSIDLRDEVMLWLGGGVREWLIALAFATIGAGLTWLDKYKTALKLEAAKRLPAGASEYEIARQVRKDLLGKSVLARLAGKGVGE